MFIRFNITNFLSFNEETEFNMLTGSVRNHEHHVYQAGKLKVLKAAAIYGANGAGKSNLVKALEVFQKSAHKKSVPQSLNNQKFKLDATNINKPTSFEIEFSIENSIYYYGFSFHNNRVEEEWFFESGITSKDKLIFVRTTDKENKNKLKLNGDFLKGAKSLLLVELLEENLLKPNELLLCKSEELKIKEIKVAENWIINMLVLIFPQSKYGGLVLNLIREDRFNSFTNNLLETFETGISKLEIQTTDVDQYFGEENKDLKEKIVNQLNSDGNAIILRSKGANNVALIEKGKPVVKEAIALHKNQGGEDIQFDLNEESDGTQRLLDFIPVFDDVLSRETTYVIDEIDQSLHPALLYLLISKIMNDPTTKGQLIFTTHEANLLDLKILRQDEIWFAEKNKQTGSTQLYSLTDFKPRYDLDIRKGYLNGRFGAIPFLANLEDLNWHQHEEPESEV